MPVRVYKFAELRPNQNLTNPACVSACIPLSATYSPSNQKGHLALLSARKVSSGGALTLIPARLHARAKSRPVHGISNEARWDLSAARALRKASDQICPIRRRAEKRREKQLTKLYTHTNG